MYAAVRYALILSQVPSSNSVAEIPSHLLSLLYGAVSAAAAGPAAVGPAAIGPTAVGALGPG